MSPAEPALLELLHQLVNELSPLVRRHASPFRLTRLTVARFPADDLTTLVNGGSEQRGDLTAWQRFKLGLLERGLPAASAVVYGDIYQVDGLFTFWLADRCARVVMVDAAETARFQRARLERPSVDFYKGDFADPAFMASIRESFTLGVLFDVLLHQPSLLQALHLMASKVTGRPCIAQPVLEEIDLPGAAVYLPGNDEGLLHPMVRDQDDYRDMFPVAPVLSAKWIWGLTASFMRRALRGEGFAVTFEDTLGRHPNPRWLWWGCVAERQAWPEPHWAGFARHPGYLEPTWA